MKFPSAAWKNLLIRSLLPYSHSAISIVGAILLSLCLVWEPPLALSLQRWGCQVVANHPDSLTRYVLKHPDFLWLIWGGGTSGSPVLKSPLGSWKYINWERVSYTRKSSTNFCITIRIADIRRCAVLLHLGYVCYAPQTACYLGLVGERSS